MPRLVALALLAVVLVAAFLDSRRDRWVAAGRGAGAARRGRRLAASGGTAGAAEPVDIAHHMNVVFLVLNRRDDAARRRAIRKTWATGHRNVYFVVARDPCPIPEQYRDALDCKLKSGAGSVPDDAQRLHDEKQRLIGAHLEEEANYYSDIVMAPMVEAYHNLPRKLKEAYRWAVHHTDATWFVKIDDDSAARVHAMEKFLASHPPRRRVIGCTRLQAEVRRDGKWAETDYKAGHKKARYPPLPLGSCGHAVTRDVAEYVVQLDGFEYQGEDTSLAIWVSEWKGGNVKVISSPHFTNNGDCGRPNQLSVGHMLKEDKLVRCFGDNAPCKAVSFSDPGR